MSKVYNPQEVRREQRRQKIAAWERVNGWRAKYRLRDGSRFVKLK